MIEVDVTDIRKKIREHNRQTADKISLLGWMIREISRTIAKHGAMASFLKGKRYRLIFEDIHVSLIVEKNMDGDKVPIPMIIEKAQLLDAASITRRIAAARSERLSDRDIVLQRNHRRMENLYFHLPGFLRRTFWRYLRRHPRYAFGKMGNVAVTSLGMMGSVNGWFIPVTIHPVCFGLGSIIKKPVVVDGQVLVREILHLTILLDHDVADGAPMARFISELVYNLQNPCI